jgi:hypothetical protein
VSKIDNKPKREAENRSTGTDRNAALLHRLQPSLGHGAVDDVPLNPFASWATEGSQILAQRARLNRRQLHW